MSHRQPSELLVYDEQERCPYLADRLARMPLRMPRWKLTRAQLDRQLARGDRRSGGFLYRPSCDRCAACESLRVDVADFTPNRTQRRIEKRGRRQIQLALGPPVNDPGRLRMFNQHRHDRGLARPGDELDAGAYRSFLVDSCCESFEIAFYQGGNLLAVAICDRGEESLSAVYCYFDVAHAHLSPGAYSILTQIRLCREWGLRYLYLGYFIASSRHMCYKSRYLPHERLVGGVWKRFER